MYYKTYFFYPDLFLQPKEKNIEGLVYAQLDFHDPQSTGSPTFQVDEETDGPGVTYSELRKVDT